MLLMPGSALALLKQTPSAGMGPFYPLTKPPETDADLSLVAGKRALGQVIEISGRVFDFRGNPISGAEVKIWQANAAGRYAHPADTNTAPLDPNFQGAGQLTTDRLGRYRFVTIKPGAYPLGDGLPPRPPHIHLDVQGNDSTLITQMLFPGEALNASDLIIPSFKRAALTAREVDMGTDGARRFEWNVALDGG